jgi:hypothetical protein
LTSLLKIVKREITAREPQKKPESSLLKIVKREIPVNARGPEKK